MKITRNMRKNCPEPAEVLCSIEKALPKTTVGQIKSAADKVGLLITRLAGDSWHLTIGLAYLAGVVEGKMIERSRRSRMGKGDDRHAL